MEPTSHMTTTPLTVTLDVGVDLIAALDNKDSTAGNETIKLQYQTTNTGATAVINYQVTILA